MVDSVPLDEGCEALDEKVSDEEWDKNDNRNATVAHIMIKYGSL